MQIVDLQALTTRLNEMASAYGSKDLTEGGVKIWYDTLRDFHIGDVLSALVDAPKRKRPTPDSVYAICAERRASARERIAAAERAREPGFDPDNFDANSLIAKEELAKIHAILRSPKPDGAQWIGDAFERIEYEERTGEIWPGKKTKLCGYAIKLAEQAEAIFTDKGRDVLTEYAAKTR